MKVAFLLNRVQRDSIKAIQRGESNDNHLYGLLRLRKIGIEADYLEIEQIFPKVVCNFLRKYLLNIYWVHLPLFFKILKYDIVYTSTAFGTQLIHSLYPFKKPKWVMLDFSITGLIGDTKTLKQKIMYYLVKNSAGIITIDATEEKLLREMFPHKSPNIRFMHFSVDTDFFKPLKEIPEKNIIFSPGRDPGRDFKTLFEAASGLDHDIVITTRPWTLKKLQPLPKFVICSDFDQQQFLIEYAKSKIIVLPLDIRGGINNAMGCSTLIEAMAIGKAVIVTRTPTTESYVTDGVNGLLVPAHDIQAMRDAITRLLTDASLRSTLGRNARTFATKHCQADKHATILADYFTSLNSLP